jgi:predicted alpha/beta superfamily hydrolase
MVKELVEEMIRTHLGWLIVWGNLFGGLIGLICQLATWKY